MRLEELKEYYKTWENMVKTLDLGINTHQYWKRKGYIPYNSQLLIEKNSGGLFKASLDDAVPRELTKD